MDITTLAKEANNSLVVHLAKIITITGLGITAGVLGILDGINYLLAIPHNQAYSIGIALVTPVLAYIFFVKH